MTAEDMVDAFAAAAVDHAFLGALPLYSDDPEEQAAINREYRRIKTAYTRTRNRLIKALS